MVDKRQQHQCPTTLDVTIDFRAHLEIVQRAQNTKVLVEHVAVPLPDLNALLEQFLWNVAWCGAGPKRIDQVLLLQGFADHQVESSAFV